MTASFSPGPFLLADELTLSYQGGIVDSGELDTYSVGGSILAFGDFVGVLTQHVYQAPPEIRTTVRGIRSGSYEINFAVYLASLVVPLFGGPIEFIDYLKTCLELFKHLKGEAPARVERVDNKSGNVSIHNNYGEVTIVNIGALQAAEDPRAGKAVEGFVRGPLNRGIQRVLLAEPRGRIIEIEALESEWFHEIPRSTDERPPLTATVERWLLVESVQFIEGRRTWRFHDGQTSFSARVDDERFLSRFSAGREMFGMGDQLRVQLEIIQIPRAREIKTQYIIREIIEHRHGAQQGELPL
jgi:hypothetical protein